MKPDFLQLRSKDILLSNARLAWGEFASVVEEPPNMVYPNIP